MKKRYCVIGDKGLCHSVVQRTWFMSQKEAERHAANLLIRDGQRSLALFVVEVVKVVTVKMPQYSAIAPSLFKEMD